jgi:hypothetical protein
VRLCEKEGGWKWAVMVLDWMIQALMMGWPPPGLRILRGEFWGFSVLGDRDSSISGFPDVGYGVESCF